MKLDAEKEKALRQALTQLKIAGTLVYNNARETTPFRASKFLNVLGKEIQQLEAELSVFLGDTKMRNLHWEIEKQPSLQILKRLVKR